MEVERDGDDGEMRMIDDELMMAWRGGSDQVTGMREEMKMRGYYFGEKKIWKKK